MTKIEKIAVLQGRESAHIRRYQKAKLPEKRAKILAQYKQVRAEREKLLWSLPPSQVARHLTARNWKRDFAGGMIERIENLRAGERTGP